MSEEDRRAVEAVRAGDTDRFALLVERHQDTLFRHALSLGLDRDTAADLVQESLVRAYENLDDCRDPARFHLWVGRILRNRCLDHLKSAGNRRRAVLHPLLTDERNAPERSYEQRMLREALAKALDELPPDQREAFVLKHLEGLPYGEIVELLGGSLSALKMRVHRAREALKAALEAMGFGDGVTQGGGTSSNGVKTLEEVPERDR